MPGAAVPIRRYASKLRNISPSPGDIVNELNKYVIGQDEAKKVLAIAVRNRYRRNAVKDKTLRNEIVPKNVLMIGPTGVGKTELVKRIAAIQQSPFIKVEATKFTEIGYVGRDVDSVIRDLMEHAMQQIKNKTTKYSKKTLEEAKNTIVEAIASESEDPDSIDKKDLLDQLNRGVLDSKVINAELLGDGIDFTPISFEIPGGNTSIGMIPMGDFLTKINSLNRKRSTNITVAEAIQSLANELEERNFDDPRFIEQVIKTVEHNGIVFIDEIDKLISSPNSNGKGEISREGVQRDLLPIIEGTSVSTKYGMVKTDNIMFIASGAFHTTNVSELLPELQGRLPIRVKLKSLTEGDFLKILTIPCYNLIRQYCALLEVDKVKLTFSDDGLQYIVSAAAQLNARFEDIGARRLHAVIEKVVEAISFSAGGENNKIEALCIDNDYAKQYLTPLFEGGSANKKEDYIL